MISKNHLEYSQTDIQLRNIKSQQLRRGCGMIWKSVGFVTQERGKTVGTLPIFKTRQVVATTALATELLSLDNNNL